MAGAAHLWSPFSQRSISQKVYVSEYVEALSGISFEATSFVGLGEFFITSAIWTEIQIRDTLKSIGHFPTCCFCLYVGLKQPNTAWGFKYFKL